MYKISLWCMLISQNLDFFLAKTVPNCLLLLFLLFFPAFFSSFLFTLHILSSGRKSLDKITGKPWKGDVDQFQVCRPVYAPILHQKWSVFSPISSVRMQSIYKMHSPLERSILALSSTPNADKSRV